MKFTLPQVIVYFSVIEKIFVGLSANYSHTISCATKLFTQVSKRPLKVLTYVIMLPSNHYQAMIH